MHNVACSNKPIINDNNITQNSLCLSTKHQSLAAHCTWSTALHPPTTHSELWLTAAALHHKAHYSRSGERFTPCILLSPVINFFLKKIPSQTIIN